MDIVIAFGVSIVGAWLCNFDFYELFTFASIATALYKSFSTYANDKTARR